VRRLAVVVVVLGCTGGDDIHTPVIGSIVPDRGVAGASVMVNGSYFCGQPEAADPDEADPLLCANMGALTFSGAPASVGQYTDSAMVVEVPTVPPGEVPVRVSVVGRVSNAVMFTVE
jgi:hypothetical protein